MAETDWDAIKQEIIDKIDISRYCESRLEKVSEQRGEVTACCPYHDDSTPSFCCNATSGLFKCHGCGEDGSLFDLHMHLNGLDFKEALADLASQAGVELPGEKEGKRGRPARPKIDEQLVKQWAGALRANDVLMEKLKKKRGLTYPTIEKFEIGWDGKRFTIPIRDAANRVVNVRRYAPDASRSKMINYTQGEHSYGSPPRLYGADSLRKAKGRPVIVTEGEFDRLVLEQHGFLAVTGTAGCKTWRAEWSKMLKGRKVALMLDADEEGRRAAKSVVGPSVAEEAENVRVVDLPLKEEEGKDVTDWFLAGKTLDDLKGVIKSSRMLRQESREAYNWNIKKMVIIKTDPPIYEVHCDEGILELEIDDLLRPQRFLRAFAQEFKRIIKTPKKGDRPWDDYMNEILDAAQEVPMPKETSLKGALTEFLTETLAEMSVGESENDIRHGRAIEYKGGLAFRLEPLVTTVEEHFKGAVKRNAVPACLREIGCEASKVIRLTGMSDQIRVWMMPQDMVRRRTGKLVG